MTTPDGGQGATDTGQSAGGTGTQPDPNAIDPAGQSAGAQTQPAPEAEPTVSRKDFEALRAQLQAADKKRSDAENALRQVQDKDLPAIDKLNRDLAEANARAEQAAKDLEASRIQNAFLTHADDKIKWRNPNTALKLLDLSKVTIDSGGSVIGMKDAIEALAKSDPYLLEDKKADGAETAPVGGTVPGTNGHTGTTAASKQQMASRFPATRTRGVGV
jgi:hypothetical protein